MSSETMVLPDSRNRYILVQQLFSQSEVINLIRDNVSNDKAFLESGEREIIYYFNYI